ncbi:MAG: Yip1 family protein, partial [Hyphomonadaceae bacterium]
MSEPGASAKETHEPAWRAHALAIVRRAWALLARPSAAWAAIEKEPGDLRTLFAYLAPLAAVPAIASFLRMVFSGLFSAGDALLKAALGYATSLLGVYLVGLAIHRLADTFAAKADGAKAMQTAVYASTPIWLAGIVFLFPGFDFFFIFSLYA